jgi:hypothetical protein
MENNDKNEDRIFPPYLNRVIGPLANEYNRQKAGNSNANKGAMGEIIFTVFLSDV